MKLNENQVKEARHALSFSMNARRGMILEAVARNDFAGAKRAEHMLEASDALKSSLQPGRELSEQQCTALKQELDFAIRVRQAEVLEAIDTEEDKRYADIAMEMVHSYRSLRQELENHGA